MSAGRHGPTMTAELSPLRQLAAVFARAIHPLAEGYDDSGGSLSRAQRTRWREAIAVTVRKYHDIAFPALVRPGVSEAAHLAASERGIDLRLKSWHDQPRFDDGRRTFHFEHYWPVAEVVTQVLGQDESSIRRILLGDALNVVWILKEEDRRLNDSGARHERPDPAEAYALAGIRLRCHPAVADG